MQNAKENPVILQVNQTLQARQESLLAQFAEGKKQFLEGNFEKASSYFTELLAAKYTAFRMDNRLASVPEIVWEDCFLVNEQQVIFNTDLKAVIFCKPPTAGIEDWHLETETMYTLGLDCLKDNPEQALQYFETAASRGHVSAQYQAGRSYFSGIGVKQEAWKGFVYFLCAALGEHPKAYEFLSICYQDGLLIQKNDETACQHLHAAFFYASLPENSDNLLDAKCCIKSGFIVFTQKQSAELARIYFMQALSLEPLSLIALKNIKAVFEAGDRESEYRLFILAYFEKNKVFEKEPHAIIFPDAEYLDHLYDFALGEFEQNNMKMGIQLMDLVFKQNRLVPWNADNPRNEGMTSLANPDSLMQHAAQAKHKGWYSLTICYFEATLLLTDRKECQFFIYKHLKEMLSKLDPKSDALVELLANRALTRNGQFELAKIYFSYFQKTNDESKYVLVACDIKLNHEAQVKEALRNLMKKGSRNQKLISEKIRHYLKMAEQSDQTIPNEHEIIKLYGNWAFSQKWYALAIMFYTHAITIKEDFPAATFNMAQSYRAMQNWESAKTFYIMTIMLDSRYLKAHIGLLECLYRENPGQLTGYLESPERQSIKEDLCKAIIQARDNREVWAIYLLNELGLQSPVVQSVVEPAVEPVKQTPPILEQPVIEPIKQAPSAEAPFIEQPELPVPQISRIRKKKTKTKKIDWQDLFNHCHGVADFAVLINKLEKNSFIPQEVPALVVACIANHQETDKISMVEMVEESSLREVKEAVQNQMAMLLPVQEESIAIFQTEVTVEAISEQPVKNPCKPGSQDDSFLQVIPFPHPAKRQRSISITCETTRVYSPDKYVLTAPKDKEEPPVRNKPSTSWKYLPGSKDDNFLPSISHSLYRQRSISITCQAEAVYPASQFATKYSEGDKAFAAKDFQKSLSCYLEAEKLMGLSKILHQKIISCALKLASHAEPEMKKYLSLALDYLQKVKGKRASHEKTVLSFLEYFTLRNHFESAYIFMEQGGERLQKLIETMANQHNWANILRVGFRQYLEKQRQMAQKVDNLDINPPLPLADEYLVGEHYDYGLGVAADFEKAFAYYQIAARKNDVTALMRLAFCYQHGGLGLQPNSHKALYYYRRAASLNCGEAWSALGHFYAEGSCVEQDLNIAAQCFQSAAHLQYFQAQYEWGLYLCYAPLASHDSFLGQACIEAAAFQGFEPAIQWLACNAEYFKYRIEVLIESGKYQSALVHCHVVLQWEQEWKEGKAIIAHCEDMLDLRKDDVRAEVTIPEVLPAPSQEKAGKNLVQLSLFKRKETVQVIPCVIVKNATLSANIELGLPSTPALKKIYRELMNTLLEQLDDQSFAYTYDIANSPEKMVHTLLIYDASALQSMIDFLGKKGVNLQYSPDSYLTLSK